MADPFEDLQSFMEDHSEARALGQRLLDDHQALLDAFERSGGQAVDIETETGEYFCTCYFDRDMMARFRAAIGPTNDWERDFGEFLIEAIKRGVEETSSDSSLAEASSESTEPPQGSQPNEG